MNFNTVYGAHTQLSVHSVFSLFLFSLSSPLFPSLSYFFFSPSFKDYAPPHIFFSLVNGSLISQGTSLVGKYNIGGKDFSHSPPSRGEVCLPSSTCLLLPTYSFWGACLRRGRCFVLLWSCHL